MYTVALNVNDATGSFSITVRDMERSPHWLQTLAPVHETVRIVQWRDTREEVRKYFTPLAQFATETAARKFAAVIEAAYAAAGYQREYVQVEQREYA